MVHHPTPPEKLRTVANVTFQWTKKMWPPSSPDLNPLDFSVWSLLEVKVCSIAHPSIDALKQSLQRQWAKISQKELSASVENFRQRIERVIQVKGHHIKN